MSNKNTETESGTIVQERLKKPSLYNVLLLNDDFTPMDFVVLILKTIFSKDEVSAHQIMMQVHNEGKGLAGTYPFDIAETKVVQVLDLSKKNQHPLKCVMEKDS